MRKQFQRPKSKPKSNNFRFEYVNWSQPMLDELRVWLDGNENSLEDALCGMSDRGWKFSTSENQRTGRYLVSITDKWGRPGCANVSYGFEHSSLVSAIMGAFYYATEIIDNGDDTQDKGSSDDLW